MCLVRGVEVRTEWASVQPATGRQTQILPEHRRNDETLAIYTEGPLYTSDAKEMKKSDIIVHLGRRFEVFTVKMWMGYNGKVDHYEAIAVLEAK